MKKISVIVPCYNVSTYLDKCVESITKQTYKNLEIILVDDGSTDDTGDKCDLWGKKDNRIKIYHKKNGGLSSARNYGIDHCSGDYIAFVDSDDFIHPNMYESMYNCLISTNSDITICRFKKFYENDNTVDFKCDNCVIELNDSQIMNELLKGSYSDHAWNKLYKKELFSKIRYPEGKNFEDIGTTYKILDISNKICIINNEYYGYLIRGNSITGKISLKSLYDMTDLVNERFDYLLNNSFVDKNILIANKIHYIYLYFLNIAKFFVNDKFETEKYKIEYDFYKKNYSKAKKIHLNDIRLKDKILKKLLFLNKNLFISIISFLYRRKK